MRQRQTFKFLAQEERDRLLDQIDEKSSLTVKVSRKDLHAARNEVLSNGVTIDAVIKWVLREISLRREYANVLIDGGKSVAHKSVTAVNVFDEIQRLHEATVK